MTRLRLGWDRRNGWYYIGHSDSVWGYRTPWGAWLGWRRFERTHPWRRRRP